MSTKTEPLCKWNRGDYQEHLDRLRKIIAKPKYVCLRCGRAASKKKHLCCPEPLD